jgi:hypothetical protein
MSRMVKRSFTLISNMEEQVIDAMRVTVQFFEAHPELKEIRAEFPRGPVYSIVKAALGRYEETFEADRAEDAQLSTYVPPDSK